MSEIDGEQFSLDAFTENGLFVVRNAVHEVNLSRWMREWSAFYASLGARAPCNPPVEVAERSPASLREIHLDTQILNIVEQIFGPDIAVYNQRFVIKDAACRGPIFFHDDIRYHIGNKRKLSAFVALSEANAENGGLSFYLGSHKLKGELARDARLDLPLVTPSLLPGDVVLMDSYTHHGSGPYRSGPDRVLCDVIYQPADDPSSVVLARGQWRTTTFLDNSKRGIK